MVTAKAIEHYYNFRGEIMNSPVKKEKYKITTETIIAFLNLLADILKEIEEQE